MPTPHPVRELVVNADDFGRSSGINAGILEAHEHGIVTSASLVVLWPDSEAAAQAARERPSLGVGLHLDLGEWVEANGDWRALYERVPADDVAAVERELRRQLDRFRELMAREPTHLDSHQHVHLSEPVRGVCLSVAGELGLPLRRTELGIRYCGDFYGQGEGNQPVEGALTPENLVAIIASLPPGATELACHPGRGVGEESTYREEREREVEALCDPRVRTAVEREGVLLRTFADVCRPG